MAENKTLRLNKVLRELNISLDRAVEHLAKNGIEIEARPTSKISNDVYNVLLDGFQTDRSKKAASKEVGEEKRKEKEALREALEKEQEEKRLAEERARKEIFKTDSEKVAFKKVGQIDLDPSPKKEEKPKEVSEPAPVAEEVKEEKPVVEVPLKEEVVKKEVKVKETVVEEVKEVPEALIKEKVKEPKAPKVTEEKPIEKTPTDTKIQTQYKKLGGPKLTGQKIDLKQFEKPKKKKETVDKTKKKEADKQNQDRKSVV